MSEIVVERLLDRPRAEVFSLLADFKAFHKVYALVDKSPLHEGSAPTGVGAERTCYLTDGNQLHERIAAMEEGRSLTVDIYDSTMPIKSCTVRFELADQGKQTKLTITATYKLKFGVLGKLMDAMAVKKQFTGNLNVMIAGIDHHLRTGEYIDESYVGSLKEKVA
ncbi:MAG: SRPBCC family protein [Myxococcota bacterium]